jgi:hypothetical protein
MTRPRALKDWNVIALIIVAALAVLVSVLAQRIPASYTSTATGVLSAIWIVMLFILYGLISEALQETKSTRSKFLNFKAAKELMVISVEDFVQRESRLSKGDSVLVFTNTLEHDRKAYTRL